MAPDSIAPLIVLWELADRTICGDERGRLVVLRDRRAASAIELGSTRLRLIRGVEGGTEYRLRLPGGEPVAIQMQNALIDGYLVRCGWSPELLTWVIAGQPVLLPSVGN